MRPPERYCLRGHDTWLWGRYKSSRGCRRCNRTGGGRTGRPRQTHCRQGHDLSLEGRAPGGWCRVCHRAAVNGWNFDRRLKINGGVPASRLKRLAHTKEAAATEWRSYRGCSAESAKTQAHRLWTATYISVNTADRWSIALGSHLALIYPELYRPSKKGKTA